MSTIDEQGIELETPPEEEKRPQRPRFSLDLTKEKRDEILSYLLQQLEDSKTERFDREKKWLKWRRQREAIPEATPAEHALSNASRIEIPLSQIHAQSAYAEVKGYYDTGKPYFWQLKSTTDDPDAHEDAKLLTKYLGILAYSQMDLNLPRVLRIVADEATFMGFLMVKVTWDTKEWKFKTEDDAGVLQEQTMVFHDGPSIVPIAQEDVHYPPLLDEVQTMPWISQTLHMPLHEFENKVAQGFYDSPVNDMGDEIDPKTWVREDYTESETEGQKLRGFTPGKAGLIDLEEFHFYWDIDDDGTWEDLLFTVHVDSKTIVRKLYNGIAAREFAAFGFIPRSFQLESRGVGQICELLQEEGSGTHRLRNDGMKLAAIKMLAVRKAVMRENKMTIYQGKIFSTENPREDIEPISMGEVPPSSMESENLVWNLAAQASGVSSPDRGFADPTLGTRDTFRGQNLRMQRSQGIMSTIIESTSESWAWVGLLVVFQLVRNRDRVIWNETKLGRLKPEEIDRLKKILSISIADVPRRFHFQIYTTDIEHSYEAKRDTLVKLYELTAQAQPQLVQLNMLIWGPQGMQLRQIAPPAWQQLLEIYVGSVNTLNEVYKFADFDDTENYLQNVDMMEKMIKALRAQNTAQMQAMESVRNQFGGANATGIAGSPGQSAGGAPGPGMAPGQGVVQGGGGSEGAPGENGGTGAGTGR